MNLIRLIKFRKERTWSYIKVNFGFVLNVRRRIFVQVVVTFLIFIFVSEAKIMKGKSF